jgi:hypothetical protein
MRLVARAQRVVSRFSLESRCDRRILPWNGGRNPANSFAVLCSGRIHGPCYFGFLQTPR